MTISSYVKVHDPSWLYPRDDAVLCIGPNLYLKENDTYQVHDPLTNRDITIDVQSGHWGIVTYKQGEIRYPLAGTIILDDVDEYRATVLNAFDDLNYCLLTGQW